MQNKITMYYEGLYPPHPLLYIFAALVMYLLKIYPKSCVRYGSLKIICSKAGAALLDTCFKDPLTPPSENSVSAPVLHHITLHTYSSTCTAIAVEELTTFTIPNFLVILTYPDRCLPVNFNLLPQQQITLFVYLLT